jgi:hypothetical protein
MRVSAEDKSQVGTVIGGQRYRADRGYFTIDNPAHLAAHLQSANLPTPGLSGVTSRKTGYRCPACGFAPFFKRCKCGADAERES